MDVIIIEDEETASRRLGSMLLKADHSIKILKVLESIKDSVKWLKENEPPGLAFVDIQLSDGMSFEIFRRHEVNFPVIFTTAYDEFIMQAFEYNSIDYILKPITEERLKKAIEKVKVLEWHFFNNRLKKLFEYKSSKHKEHYLVKKGLEYISISLHQAAYFFSEHKLVFLKDINSNKYLIDKPLAEIIDELDPDKFFRINRQYIANINSINNFRVEPSGKITVKFEPASKDEIIVSKENASKFRKWITKK